MVVIKALTSFAGVISMHVNEVREVADEAIARDLIAAGHAVEIKTGKTTVKAAKTKEVAEETSAAPEVAEQPVENPVETPAEPVENPEEAPVEEKTSKNKK